MKVDVNLSADLARAGAEAGTAEEIGYDGLWSREQTHDPFFPLVLASQQSESIQLGTAITVAFARNPMTTAASAWDLQSLSQGRFLLGLGSQIKAHIERRFSMPWSAPAARMREYIAAMRAIWDSWEHGTRLDFRGDFYQHTLMTPTFNPGPIGVAPPEVWLAAVGEKMTEVAAEVADGLLIHSLTTERYLREVTLPVIDRVLSAGSRTHPGKFQISIPSFVVTGNDEAEMEAAADEVRRRISFYASTPAYRPVLDLHGWGDLQDELYTLSKSGEWTKMATLIDDEILATFAVVAEPADVPAQLLKRFGDVADRIKFTPPAGMAPEQVGDLVLRLKQRG